MWREDEGHVCPSDGLDDSVSDIVVQRRLSQGRADERSKERGKEEREKDEATAARRPIECLHDEKWEHLDREWRY